MTIYSTYKVKIKHYNHIFKDTISVYRAAVDYLIHVCIEDWDNITSYEKTLEKQRFVETLIHKTKDNPNVAYDFDVHFYKFPCYLRRGAISEAIGKVSSYKSNFASWKANPQGEAPSVPKAGYIYPSMYRTNMYEQTGTYQAQIKVHIRNTWDWITVNLRKSDIDYINRHCSTRKQCAPTLQKRGERVVFGFSV